MKGNQIGRSMIEMLGILAIIGVLSIGAMTGYSKAIFKYRLNKQSQQLQQIISSVNFNFRNVHVANLGESLYIANWYYKLGFIPQEMKKDNSDYIYDIFNNKITIRDIFNSSGWVPGYRVAGILIYPYILSDSETQTMCTNILSLLKEYHENVWYVELYATFGTGEKYDFYGDKYYETTRKQLKSLTVSEITNYCYETIKKAKARKGTYYGFYIWWLND